MLESFLRQRYFLYVTFVAFVGLRLAVILLVPTAEPFSDAGWYLGRAIELVEHGSYSENGVPTAFWPVGYPAFLSFVFKVTGQSLLAARLANLALAAGTFCLLYLFTLRAFDDEIAARGAVLLLTIYPNSIAYTSLLLSETLYTFLLLGAVTLLLSTRHWLALVIAGVTFGLATLVKAQTPLSVPILGLLATLDGWSARKFISASTRAIVVGIVCMITLLPWSFRNLAVLGEPVLVSTNGGWALLAGNNPSMTTDLTNDYAADDALFSVVQFSVADQVAADKRARSLALQWIRENPGRFLALIPKKVFRLWAPDGEAEWGFQDTSFYKMHQRWFRGARWANQVFYVVMFALFLLAVWRLIRAPKAPKAYIGIAFVVISTLTSVIFSGQSRYHFPSMPFILAYASWFLVGKGKWTALNSPNPQT